MTIYNTPTYRKIYEQHYGPIPKDEDNRSYEIHHIDGNRHNNAIENLQCVSIQEHYNIHYRQRDWGACALIAKRMGLSTEELSLLAKEHNKTLVSKNLHPFQKRKDGTSISSDRVANGTHIFLSGEIQRKSNINRVLNGTNPFCYPENNKKWQQIRIQNKTHNLLGPTQNLKMLDEGRHPSQQKKTCEHCNKTASVGMYKRWHGDNCRNKQ